MKTEILLGGGSYVPSYRHPLLEKLSSYLSCLHGLSDPVAHRVVQWTPLAASLGALLMAFEGTHSLTVSCEDALLCLDRDFTGRHRVGHTYNGLVKALERQASTVLPLLKTHLRTAVWSAMSQVQRTAGWVLLAVDGSKEELPRTPSHEQEFGFGDNGIYPQAYLTAIVEVHTGLLWDWRIDQGSCSERHHLADMIPSLPTESLLLADANFVGYPIWAVLQQKHQDFLIRVGGNVRLLTNLWPQTHLHQRKDLVSVWPAQQQSQGAPLTLRLIRVGRKHHPVYLLTNVLEPQRLSRKTAGQIYQRRWGVELFYRTFKRTLGHAKLRSRTGRRGRIELEWALRAVMIMTLMGVETLRRRHRDPRQLSPAKLVGVLRRSLRDYHPTALLTVTRRALDRSLAGALRDPYRRRGSKASRQIIRTSNTPRSLILKAPQIRAATPRERLLAIQRFPSFAA